MMNVDSFIQKHKWEFLPEMTEANQKKLLSRSHKQLCILVNPSEEMEKVVEINEVNGVYPQLNNFNLVKSDKEYTQHITKLQIGNGSYVVFFNNKNPKKLKLYSKPIEDEKAFLLQVLRFKPEKMGIVDLDDFAQYKPSSKR